MLTWFKALDRVLKGEATRLDSLRGGSIALPFGGLSVLLILLGAVYGACMGAFALMGRWGTDTQASGYLQMLASASKVPMLFSLTLLVTFPSLYVFNALVGSRLGFASVGRLMVAALAVTMAVLASFGTILVFFSLCTTSYPFIVLLNVVMFAIAGVLGMRFLLQTLHRLAVARELDDAAAIVPTPIAVTAPTEVPAESIAPQAYSSELPASVSKPPGALDRIEGHAFGPHVRSIFKIWILVFGLVGAQMGWVLRPFIGNPNAPFTFFRERESNFFEAVVNKIGEVATWDTKKAKPARQRHDDRAGMPLPPATTKTYTGD
ncbi:hypothetical protein [Humisphaera borealis]|uniref:Yip1 domain-containing protein n=1 Tax=Humisphaera borealis TaxID=2807512 RepID=A0A7M2WTY4_9BACT|nr:hypothetical protein [Humisphaera borealis]QOV88913.1 hypothetical protein IPV69_22210 [Humisphaera borealis]